MSEVAADASSLIRAYTLARLSTKMADYMFRLIYEGGHRFRLYDGVTAGIPMSRAEVERATLSYAHLAAKDTKAGAIPSTPQLKAAEQTYAVC